MENNLQTNKAPEQSEATQPEQKSDNTVSKADYDALKAENDSSNATLETVFNDLSSKIPEKYRSLIPQGSVAERLRWLQSATDAGLFIQHVKQSSPDSKRPQAKPDFDMNNSSPFVMMTNGYK